MQSTTRNTPPGRARTDPTLDDPASRGSHVLLALLFILLLTMAGIFYAAFGLAGIKQHFGIVAATFGILGSLVLLINPMLVLGLVFSYFPFSYGGPGLEFGIVTFNPYSFGLLTFAFIGVLRLVVQQARIRLSVTDLFLVGTSIIYFYGLLRSADITDSGFLAFNFIFQPVLAFYVLRTFIQTKKQYRLVVLMIIAGMVPFAIVAVVSYVQTFERVMPLNTPAISTATAMVFAICMILGSDVLPKKLRMPLALLCLLAMFLTFSRVFLVTLVVSPVCYLLIKRGKSTSLFLFFFVVSMLMTFLIIIYARFVQPDQTIFKPEEYTTEQRLTNVENWKAAIYGRVAQFSAGLDNFLEHPFFGMGLYRGERVVTQHNLHVEWLEYSGVIGYSFYFLFLFSHAVRMKRAAQVDGPIRWQLLTMLLVLNNCVFNGIMHGYMPHVIFICMGLSEARERILLQQEEAPETRETARPAVATVPVSTPDAVIIAKESGETLYNRYFRS